MKESNEARIKQAYSKLQNYLENIETNDEYMKLLRFQSLFTHYSASNTMLIMLSNPNASYVAGYGAFKKMNRYVRKGEKSISIIAPCTRKVQDERKAAEEEEEELRVVGFRLVGVFDLSQTEGSEEDLPSVVKGLENGGEITQDRLRELINVCPIPVNFEGDMRPKGYYSNEYKEITINKDYSLTQQVKTLFHEWAHHLCYVGGTQVKPATEECIAESIAYVVSYRQGFDTADYSIPYLKSWGGSLFTMQIITDTVQKLSRQILDCIEDKEEANN